MIFFVLSICSCLVNIGMTIYLLFGLKNIKQIRKLPLVEKEPAIAIIIAIRNEETDLEKALNSVCNINYTNYRVIAVNDRSTDGTAAILQKFAAVYPELNIVTIKTLPQGWLGKNNALLEGYKNSAEEWLLFTDADIVFHPDVVSKAMNYAVSEKLDHLTLLPELVSPSVILNSVLASLCIMLMVHMRPWNAKKPASKAFAGLGAFNLVRRVGYETIGTHASIRLRPDDDLQLGKKFKLAGLRQDVLAGNQYLCLEWYKNLKQFGNGLLKNSFAVAEYKLGNSIANVCSILLSFSLPLPVFFIFGSPFIRLMAGYGFITPGNIYECCFTKQMVVCFYDAFCRLFYCLLYFKISINCH